MESAFLFVESEVCGQEDTFVHHRRGLRRRCGWSDAPTNPCRLRVTSGVCLFPEVDGRRRVNRLKFYKVMFMYPKNCFLLIKE